MLCGCCVLCDHSPVSTQHLLYHDTLLACMDEDIFFWGFSQGAQGAAPNAAYCQVGWLLLLLLLLLSPAPPAPAAA